MQADIFNTQVTALKYEEGPGVGAAMLAAYGLGWFNTMQACAETFIALGETYKPNIENHKNINSILKFIRIYTLRQNDNRKLIKD